jgi:hypothetical protein
MTHGYGDCVPEQLCTCETYWECEWHRQLRGPDVIREDLEFEMENIIDVSHAVWWGYESPERGWELIKGRPCYYWRPR